MNTYETIFICPGEISQEKLEATLEKVKSLITHSEGKVNTAELWGRRKLSYPIKRCRDGFYVYLIFEASPKVPGMLTRHYRITDSILKGLTVKVDPRHLEKIRPQIKAAAEAAEDANAVPLPPAAPSPNPPLAPVS
ncbi:MAG: 30S ribosomal protein S6 [Elusimicrobia bacterium]|nr:30S ribosomal protein S6 [Elusimicrobiota bacterium]